LWKNKEVAVRRYVVEVAPGVYLTRLEGGYVATTESLPRAAAFGSPAEAAEWLSSRRPAVEALVGPLAFTNARVGPVTFEVFEITRGEPLDFAEEIAAVGEEFGFDGEGDGWDYPGQLAEEPHPLVAVTSPRLLGSEGFLDLLDRYGLRRLEQEAPGKN
jgi:hypothetical protein